MNLVNNNDNVSESGHFYTKQNILETKKKNKKRVERNLKIKKIRKQQKKKQKNIKNFLKIYSFSQK